MKLKRTTDEISAQMGEPAFERIVLAVDRVEDMGKAMRVALDMKHRFGAELLPLHVVDIPQEPSMPEHYEKHRSGTVDTEDLLQEIEEREGTLVDEFCDRLETIAEKEAIPCDCGCRIGVGDPAETLISFSRDVDADLIVMGVHRRGGLDRLLHESVSTKVLRESSVPVLTVKTS